MSEHDRVDARNDRTAEPNAEQGTTDHRKRLPEDKRELLSDEREVRVLLIKNAVRGVESGLTRRAKGREIATGAYRARRSSSRSRRWSA
jgi:hypothetical protein